MNILTILDFFPVVRNGSCDFILKKNEKNANRALFLLKNGKKDNLLPAALIASSA